MAESLNGFVTEHFRWLLKETMQELGALNQKLLQMDRRIAECLRPHEDLVWAMHDSRGGLHGGGNHLAEIGFDMSRFLTPERVASWAVLPGQ